MHKIVSYLYEISVIFYFVFVLFSVIMWSILSYLLDKRKIWRAINIVLLLIWICVIILVTLAFRSAEKSGVIWIPFSSFSMAHNYSDIYNEIVLNIVLFVPLGLTLPFILKNKINHPVIISILFAFLFSLSIETLQFFISRGLTETDDVIFNTLGAAIGSIAFTLSNWFIQKKITIN